MKAKFIAALKKKLKVRYRLERLESKLITFQTITKLRLVKQNILRDLKLNIRLNKTLRALNRREALKVL